MRVVLPASGWEMMAKVRRRLISWAGVMTGEPSASSPAFEGWQVRRFAPDRPITEKFPDSAFSQGLRMGSVE